ncbi:response regulator [Litorivicinus lipolyticus]|uniref:response regulator n=1 Tax=Litorivicinus lipolyticus TaxID=418701 RepID=UPI003B5A0E9E
MSLALSDLLLLVVEPSSMQQKALSALLRARGVQHIVTAKTGNEAFTLLQSQTPDLVLSSFYLDDMTGSDLVRGMRREDALTHVPFVLVSSETRFEPLDPIRQAGVIALIDKRAPEQGLDEALAATLEYLQPSRIDLGNIDSEDVVIGLADDSRMARRHMLRTLNALGFERIHCVEDGAQAQQLIAEQNLDILITDLHMPNVDGEALCRWVRNESAQNSIPILAVTSDTDQQRLDSVMQAGANHVCTKPFDINHLRQLLPQLLK